MSAGIGMPLLQVITVLEEKYLNESKDLTSFLAHKLVYRAESGSGCNNRASPKLKSVCSSNPTQARNFLPRPALLI